jgi:hypothetical protein
MMPRALAALTSIGMFTPATTSARDVPATVRLRFVAVGARFAGSRALHVRDRHRVDAFPGKGVLHVTELDGPNDGLELLHR